jgi:Tol biopolymer transport system component
VSRDGKWLAYVESNPKTGNDVWTLGLNPSEAGRAIVNTDADEAFPTFSPDGRVLAYTSTESGQPEAYVQLFPERGRPVQATRGGARALSWSRDGKSLLYLVGRSQLMAVTIERDISLRVGDTRKIADARIGSTTPVGSIDMAEDGSFLVTFDVDAPSAAPPLPQLQLLVNALSGLHAR